MAEASWTAQVLGQRGGDNRHWVDRSGLEHGGQGDDVKLQVGDGLVGVLTGVEAAPSLDQQQTAQLHTLTAAAPILEHLRGDRGGSWHYAVYLSSTPHSDSCSTDSGASVGRQR